MRHLVRLQHSRRLFGRITLGALSLVFASGASACGRNPPPNDDTPPVEGPDGRPISGQRRVVRPGLSVLLNDSIRLITGKRVGLITNQTGIDERGRSAIDLLFSDQRAVKANVKLVALFSPEHGIRGTEDRTNIANSKDEKTGLPIYSLYTNTTVAPPDSIMKTIDVLVVDLQDIGTRTWTYVGVMLFAMRAGERNNVPVVVLDRPNPLTGSNTEGALLDSALANPEESTRTRPANGFALWPMPLRHGLTMGEMARYFVGTLKLGTVLHVVPMRNWRRTMWFDDTGLPWVKPSPNMPNITSALLYPALVPFEGTNVSVGRGTNEPFQRFGASWMRADVVAQQLEELEMSGVRFRAERFTPVQPGDRKFAGQNIPGVRMEVIDRDFVQPARIGAAIFWVLNRLHGDSMVVRPKTFDERLGSTRVREALLTAKDPDAVMDRELPGKVSFEREARKYHLYR